MMIAGTPTLVWRDTCWRCDWNSPQWKSQILKTVTVWM